jgi:hypothetical protein
MRHRFSSVVILLAASLSISAEAPYIPTDFSGTDPDGLVVHEWGTFTSVAAEDGTAVDWVPQQGPRDLPCFVDRVQYNIKGWLPARVRMETPVLYFYSPDEKAVDVRVRFPQGIITEWYPRAEVAPTRIELTTLRNPGLVGTIGWNQVRVLPRAAEDYPVESGANHYYAARKTDASPLEIRTEVGNAVDGQREKFLFYRGIGNFPLPLTATVSAEGQVVVSTSNGQQVGDVMLFENTGGTMGYQALRSAKQTVTLERPAAPRVPTPAVRSALERMLVAQGLYQKEAAAMVDTWRDSWFEEGLRLFYIVPRSAVDEILPLEINPAPASVARVFVGRIELITQSTVDEVKEAVLRRDRGVLVRHARFLRPIIARVVASSTAAEAVAIERSLSAAYASVAPASGVCK